MKRAAFLTTALVMAGGMATAQDAFDCLIDPSLVVEIGSAEAGIIQEVFVTRGDVVTKGQMVARLESAAELAALDYARTRATDTSAIDIANARIKLLESEVARAESLGAKNLLPEAIVDEKRSEYEEATLNSRQVEFERGLALLDQTRVEAQLARRVIYSPVDGLLITAMIGPGEYVFSDAPVAQIAQINPLHIEVFLPTSYYPSLEVGQYAVVSPAEPIGGDYLAEIIVIDKVFDAASDTFGLRLRLDNPESEIPAGIDCKVVFD